MSKIKFSQEEINIIIEEYKKGVSQTKLASRYKVSRGVMNRILLKNNIEIRGVKDTNQRYLPQEVKEQIIQRYLEGHGLESSGKPFNCSQKVVETILKDAGIKKRNYEQAKQIQRKYSVNDDYFKTQSSNMAYILGFLAADGNIASKENCINIQLQESDKDHLEHIKQEVESTRPLDFYTSSSGHPTVKFSVWSAQWKKDLAIYNIVPNKTFILKPPTFLKSQYFIDYIRGYFDGDGSISSKTNRPNDCSFEIVGASKEMISWIKDVFANQYGIVTPSILTEKTNNEKIIYKIAYYSITKIKSIYDILYSTNTQLYLQRKKEKFETLLK